MSHTREFDIGDVPRLRARMRNYDGEPVDPETIRIVIDPPGLGPVEAQGSAPTYTPFVRAGLGEFYYDADLLTVDGTYEFRWEVDGAYKGAEQGRFKVRKKNVAAPSP